MLDDLSTGAATTCEPCSTARDFHLVVDSVLSPSGRERAGLQVRRRLPSGRRRGRPAHRRAARAHDRHERAGHGDGARVLRRFEKRVLVASSSEVYGDHREERAARRGRHAASTGRRPQRRWLYADSKAMDESSRSRIHQERGLDCVIARLFNTVGPRQRASTAWSSPASCSARSRASRSRCFGDGTQTRCVLPCSRHGSRAAAPHGGAAPDRPDLQRRLAEQDLDCRARQARHGASGSSSELDSSRTTTCTGTGSRT